MALIQMPDYNAAENHVNELTAQVADLQSKLHDTEATLVSVCQERDTVATEVQRAIAIIDQRDASIKKIEDTVRQLTTMAERLHEENNSLKASNDKLGQALQLQQEKVNELLEINDRLFTNTEIVKRIEKLEALLDEKLSTLNEEERMYFEKLCKNTSNPNEAVYQMKVLSSLSAIDQATSKLHNYNDTRCIEGLTTISEKIDNIISSNKVGILCAVSVIVGFILSKAIQF